MNIGIYEILITKRFNLSVNKIVQTVNRSTSPVINNTFGVVQLLRVSGVEISILIDPAFYQ